MPAEAFELPFEARLRRAPQGDGVVQGRDGPALAHGGDRSRSGTARCASACSANIVAAFFELGEARRDNQILDGNFALGLFVRALDDDAGALRLSAYFICGPNLPEPR